MLELTANNFTHTFDIDLSTLSPEYTHPSQPMLVYFKQSRCMACQAFDSYYMEFDRTKNSMFPNLILALAYVTPELYRKASVKGSEFLKQTPTIMFYIGGMFVCKIEYPSMPSGNFGATINMRVMKFLEDYKNLYPTIFNPPVQTNYSYQPGPQMQNQLQNQMQYRNLTNMNNPQQSQMSQFTPSFHQPFAKKPQINNPDFNLFTKEYDVRLKDVDWNIVGLSPKGKNWSKDFSELQRKLLYP